jgi:hypothetical protein
MFLAARTAGTVPWWIDPEFHQAFLRPIASLSLALDFALWPSAPWLMHLENSLLFAGLVLLAASLYQAFGLPRRARGVASFFFAMQAAQSMTTGWISGRNTLLAAVFGFGAVRLFIAAQSGKRTRLAALAAFALALLSAEGGVAALAYLFAYAHCFGAAAVPVSGGTSRALPEAKSLISAPAPLAQRWGALWGFAVLVVAWLIVYRAYGYGVKHSGFYVDPSQDPLQFLCDLLSAIPIYLASQLTVPFAGASGMHPLAVPFLTVVSLAILFVSRSLWLPWVRQDSRARALGLGALLAVMPLGSSVPQDRLVSFIALGVCGVLALIVEERLGPQAGEMPQRGARRLWRYHAVWAPLLYVPFLFGSLSMIAGGGAIVLDRVLGADVRPVLLVNAPSYLPVHFFARKRAWYGDAHPPVDLLYAGGSEVELTRSAEQSLELVVARGYFFGRFERSDREPRRRPLRAGDVIDSARMRVVVLEVADGAPTRVRFELASPLTEARVYAWQGRKVVPLTPPKLGQTIRIQAASAM